MAFTTVIVEKNNGIVTLTLNRPQALNAITITMLQELKQAIDEAGNDPDVGVVVFTGMGRAFSAGVDLKELGKRSLEKGGIGPILDDPARTLIGAVRRFQSCYC
jgi:enoyl-CoA hydratase/carnithine racemase